MTLIWDDLTVCFKHIERTKLTEDWQWLVGTALPILVTSIGDMFLQNEVDEIYWLMTGSAEYIKVADNYEEFQNKLQDNELVNEWFLSSLVAKLKEQGKKLEKGKLYGFKKLPILGGKYEESNFEPTDIEVHFALCGQMNYQIKDLTDGAKVKFTVKD